MRLDQYKHSFLFFALSLLIPWAMWFTAAWFSWQPAGTLNSIMMSSLGLLGLCAPAVVAGVLFLKKS